MDDAAPLKILAICLGNVCRSPMIEQLLRARLPEDTHVESAGLIATAGAPMDARAASELVRLGGKAEGPGARPFRAWVAKDADLVLTATAAIKSRVLEECPAALRRTFTLREFAFLVEQAPDGTPRERITWAGAHRSLGAGQEWDIVDPIGQSPEVHREAADSIDEATRIIADGLAR